MGEESFIEWLVRISRKWGRIWEKEKVYESDPSVGKPKYFVTAAFMYPNGPAHVGHARTYLIPDVLARFKRGLGYNVLFPMGFHYTGTPILTTAERIASGDEAYIKKLAEAFGVSEDDLRGLTEPVKLANYFHGLSKKAMMEYGLSIDWRREFTTIDPEFNKFIVWQFTKLREMGYLTKGSHPVGWCPKHNMPVGMHDTKDDVEPEIGELTIVKFLKGDGLVFPAATLRPETVLGVTNMWVNPEVEYCISEVEVNGKREKWILACEAADKLKFQMDLRVLKRGIKGKELVGQKVINPALGNEVEILSASFVSPKFGTGIVMSVPAHAPYDYVAIRDYLGEESPEKWGRLKPIPLIKVSGYGELPAKDSVERLGIASQKDVDKLEKATKEVYRDEYSKGVLLEGLRSLVVQEIIEGVKAFIKDELEKAPVSLARERIKALLIKSGYGTVMFEIMNAPVYCRCGTEIVVKVVKDQWFIDYGNKEWKEKAMKALDRMRIIPEEARNQFIATVDWLRAKACARSRGLGTELPWARGWIIESLSDSTIYMAFYTVIHKIRKYRIPPEKLIPSFWDYIMRGEGDPESLSKELGIKTDILRDLRGEFDYWYPLNSRHSGKDLIPNHLTFFVFNHAAIFPEEKWPKQIVANGWVLIKGEKMSKSKGNVRTLHGLIHTYSPDAVRLALSVEAEVEADLNLDLDSMGKIYDHLKRIKRLISEISKSSMSENYGLPERWVRNKVARHLINAYTELDAVRVRAAGVRIFYLIPKVLEEYLSMVAKPSKSITDLIEYWVKAISAYTPFIAEELWHNYLGKQSLVVRERWPSVEELKSLIDDEAEAYVAYAEKVAGDIKSISKVVKGDTAIIYVSPRSEQEHLLKIREIIENGGKLGDVIKYVSEVWRKASGKKAVRIAKALIDMVSSIDPEVVNSLRRLGGIDEASAISALRSYVESKAGVKIAKILRSDDPSVPDYGGRREEALPWRPSIYLMGVK